MIDTIWHVPVPSYLRVTDKRHQSITSHGGECYEFNLLLEANQLTLSQAVRVRWCHLEEAKRFFLFFKKLYILPVTLCLA